MRRRRLDALIALSRDSVLIAMFVAVFIVVVWAVTDRLVEDVQTYCGTTAFIS